VRHIALFLAWLPLLLAAQTAESLLTELSALPEGADQLALLAKATRVYAQQGKWEDATDLADMGVTKAREQDLPAMSAEFELVMAEVARMKNDRDGSIAHALRANTYAQEGEAPLRARCSLFLAKSYMNEHVASKGYDYAAQALELGSLDEQGARSAMLLRTQALVDLKDDERADASVAELITNARSANDQVMLKDALGIRSTIRFRRNDLQGAIAAESERLPLVNGTDRGIVLNNLGELYARSDDQNKAHEFFGEAAIWLSSDNDLYGRTLLNSAIAYGRQKQYALAEAVIENAISIIGGRGSGQDLSQALQVKAGILLLSGRFSEAMSIARQALDDARRTGAQDDEFAALGLLSRISLERGALVENYQYDRQAATLQRDMAAKQELNERLRSEQENALHRQERDINALASNEQRERLRQREAVLDAENQANQFGLLVSEKELQDSKLREEALAREKAQQELRLLQGAMADERHRGELQQLQDERTVQMLQLSKLDLERKQKESGMAMLQRQNVLLKTEAELKEVTQHRTRLINRFALVAVVLFAGVAGFFFWLMRKVKGKNRLIRTQVDQIEVINSQLSDKNADLLSSINYAQNIQRTIIPTEQQLRSLLPDSFLYYRPRDIVSGDLPFVRKVGERLFVATIDCTGHGVPAAMLSFMAYYNLNDIISTHKDFNVGDILMLLHQRIQAAVQQNATDHSLSDGMDVTLVELDLRERTLWYSGAQNSLVVVRDGQSERIKGNKCSIGDPSGDLTNGFQVHRMELKPSDRVYLYSDGLIHQFGGEDGRKKYSNSQLMRTVGALSSMSAVHTGEQLTEQHLAWQGDEHQTDDIVLIGFSIDKEPAVMAA
jgi:serine phosphatase RsbU (regulator of sigma subunit)/tetratricopeptide (TPR) repeat protein